MHSFHRHHRGLHIGRPSSRSSGIFDTLLSLVFGSRRPHPFCFLVFWMLTLQGVESIGNQLRILASFWVLHLSLCLLANNLVSPSLLQKLSDFGEESSHVPVMCDSTSAISVAKNPMLHSRTKHIEVRYHFLRDNAEKGNIHLIHVPTEKQLADILTKPLERIYLRVCRESLESFSPFEPRFGGLMYICMLNSHLCIISCLRVASLYHRLHLYHMS
jgi:hypothetical protein